MFNRELNDTMKKYMERFNDIFPTLEISFKDETDLLNKINYCLEREEPAKVVYNITYENEIKY